MAFLLVGGWSGAVAKDGAPRVVAVLYPETEAPYRQIFAEILDGIQRGATGETVRSYALSEPPDAAGLRQWLDREKPAVTITLGRLATKIYETFGLGVPHVVGALDASPQQMPGRAGVGLAVDPALLFATLKQLVPTKRRVWVVFDPSYDRWLIDLAQQAASSSGLKLEALGARDLRESARQFTSVLQAADPATDAIWLVADARITDSETILPLVVEKSWQRRLLVFSNNLQHIKRGVLFGLFPDNTLLGQRLAELAERALRAPSAPSSIEVLHAVKRAINLKIAAHLDLAIDQALERQFDLVLPVW